MNIVDIKLKVVFVLLYKQSKLTELEFFLMSTKARNQPDGSLCIVQKATDNNDLVLMLWTAGVLNQQQMSSLMCALTASTPAATSSTGRETPLSRRTDSPCVVAIAESSRDIRRNGTFADVDICQGGNSIEN